MRQPIRQSMSLLRSQMLGKLFVCAPFALCLMIAREAKANDAGVFGGSCTEVIPQGATKPTLVERVVERENRVLAGGDVAVRTTAVEDRLGREVDVVGHFVA